MPPDAVDSEEVERLDGEHQPLYQGHRILPEGAEPAQAWAEQEGEEVLGRGSPGESRRLLGGPPPPPKSRLQAGLTLTVANAPKKHPGLQKSSAKLRQKTKFEKRRERLFAILKPPYFILTMILINFAIHLWLPEQLRALLEWAPGAWRREPWRLLSYGFVHATAAHLALNAVVALAVGWRLEREQAWWRVACVWAGGVAAGALGAGALQPRVRVVGASAAVYGLLTAHLPNVCLRYGHVPLWWFRPLSVLVLGASEAWWALSRTHVQAHAHAHADEHVAWAAHALGAAAGLPLAMLLFRGENDSKLAIKAGRVASALLLAGGLIAAAIHFTVFYDIDRD